MRISDWRSDVCSSDLLPHLPRLRAVQRRMQRELDDRDSAAADGRDGINDGARRRPRDALGGAAAARAVDRKSVVSGKSVSVRVERGGRRIFKKKINIKRV